MARRNKKGNRAAVEEWSRPYHPAYAIGREAVILRKRGLGELRQRTMEGPACPGANQLVRHGCGTAIQEEPDDRTPFGTPGKHSGRRIRVVLAGLRGHCSSLYLTRIPGQATLRLQEKADAGCAEPGLLLCRQNGTGLS